MDDKSTCLSIAVYSETGLKSLAHSNRWELLFMARAFVIPGIVINVTLEHSHPTQFTKTSKTNACVTIFRS